MCIEALSVCIFSMRGISHSERVRLQARSELDVRKSGFVSMGCRGMGMLHTFTLLKSVDITRGDVGDHWWNIIDPHMPVSARMIATALLRA